MNDSNRNCDCFTVFTHTQFIPHSPKALAGPVPRWSYSDCDHGTWHIDSHEVLKSKVIIALKEVSLIPRTPFVSISHTGSIAI